MKEPHFDLFIPLITALGCFQVGATIYDAATNILVCVFGDSLPAVLLDLFLGVGCLSPASG